MERVRAFDIAQEGFRLVQREPKAVFVWGLLISLIQVVAPLGMVAWIFSQGSFWENAMSGATGAENPALQALETQLNLLQLVLLPLTLLVTLVVTAAVYRAILEPEARERFFMRVGASEGWMLLVGIVACIVIGAPLVIALLLVVGVAFAIAAASQAAAVGVTVLLSLAVMAAYFWIGARFAMAAPMAFKDKEFRLFESWTLTRGHAWLIIRVWLAMFLLLIAAAVAVGIGFLLLFVMPIVAIAVPLGISAQAMAPEVWVAQHLGLLIGLGVVFGLLYLAASAFIQGAYVAIVAAPFARVFQILTGQTSKFEAVFGPDPTPVEDGGAPDPGPQASAD